MSKITVEALRHFWDNENKVLRKKGDKLTISEDFYNEMKTSPVEVVRKVESYPKAEPIKEKKRVKKTKEEKFKGSEE